MLNWFHTRVACVFWPLGDPVPWKSRNRTCAPSCVSGETHPFQVFLCWGGASWGLCSSRRFLVWQPWPVLVQPVSCHVPLPRGRGCALPPRAPSGRAGCRAAERVGTRTGVEHPHPEDLASLPPFLPQGGPALLPQHPRPVPSSWSWAVALSPRSREWVSLSAPPGLAPRPRTASL